MTSKWKLIKNNKTVFMQNMHISPNKTLTIVGRKPLGWDQASKSVYSQFVVRNFTRTHA